MKIFRFVLGILWFLQVFLKSMDDFAAVNSVYERAFGNHKPSRSAVEVARLPKDLLVEIECIARYRVVPAIKLEQC